jgi:hypothetical protein
VSTRAVDSFAPHTEVSAAALRAAGISLALRYHYNLTDAEIALLHVQGVDVGLIGEYDTLTWHPILAGPGAGDRHGIDIVAKAVARRFPRGTTALFATSDTGVAPAQYAEAGRYMAPYAARVRAAGYVVGIYGGEGLVDYLLDAGLADEGWGAGATSWNYGHRSERLALRQLPNQAWFGGVLVDLNDRFREAGAWLAADLLLPAAALVVGSPTPPAPPAEQDHLTMSDVSDVSVILDKIDQLGLGMLALQLNAGAPRTSFRLTDSDWTGYIDRGPTGAPVRVHIPDPATLDMLKAVGWVDHVTLELEPGALHAALDVLPLVEFTASP